MSDLEVAFDPESAAAGSGHAGGAKLHLGVVSCVEEVGRAQVFVACADAGPEAGDVDGQRHPARLVLVDVEPAVEALEMSLDGDQAPEVRDAKLGIGG